MDKFVIIDGNSLINRAFYALPLLTNSKGEYSNGVYGFVNILIKAILDLHPKYIAVAMDYSRHTFRNELYREYKGKRKETPAELKPQFAILKSMLECMGIKYIEKEGYEADDIIGTLSCAYNTENIIITGDRDSLQLIDDRNTVYLTKKGISEVKVMNDESYFEEYSLKPSQVVDLKALMGDASDNIPGVPGVGEKTALSLMRQFGSLDNIYQHLDELSPRVRGLMVAGKDSAYLSKKLSTILTNIDLDVSLSNFTYSFPFDSKVYEFFKNYDFNSLIKKSDLFSMDKEEKKQSFINANTIVIEDLDTLKKHIKYAQQTGIVALEQVGDTLHLAYDKNCEIVLPCKVDLTSRVNFFEVLDLLKELLQDEKIEKLCYDIKSMKHLFKSYGIDLVGSKFDVNLAYYLLYAGEREANRDNVLATYDMSEALPSVSLFYLRETLARGLEENNLKKLYDDIEFPLIDVLFDMEMNGFRIDTAVYHDIKSRYSAEVKDMEENIKRIAGFDFNVNSPKQLGEVLFDRLGLVSGNNKKKSTSIEHLEEMCDLHPIIPAIIRYRKVSKFLSTYVEPYGPLIATSPVIHTMFNQTLTQTGRLSSSKPNLQNIPVRDDEGRALRKMFVSNFEDGGLVSADYSQIELRLLAHMSDDKYLIEAFRENIDIHSVTASEIFDVPIQEVTPLMRRTAKATNFGIIYGISQFGLSQNIGTSRKEAKRYIDKYFERYPKIKQFMDNNIDTAKKTGYAFTLFNRRRRIIELDSPNYMTRQFGERIAMNMPLQGTASDIIKLAMIKVARELKSRNMRSKMILQVHDELIIDCPREEVGEVCNILKENMENVVKLSVPLIVDVSFGKTWFDC